MELSIQALGVLWVVGFIAGFVDSIAGGGGIITIPALLAAGLDPHLALGTNKLQATFGSCTASVHYARQKLVDIRHTIPGVFFTAIGAAIGTLAIQMIAADFLRMIIPILLAIIFFYLLFSPDLGHIDRKPKAHPQAFNLVAGLLIGFYDGFFGPGTGSFWMIAFVVLMGQNMMKATAHTKIMNATSNLVSLITFILGGKVLWLPGIIMGTGQLVGATLGSRMVILKGTRFVKPIFLGVVAVTIARLIYTTYIAPQ